MKPSLVRELLCAVWLTASLGVASATAAAQDQGAKAEGVDASARITAIADRLLKHLQDTSADVRSRSGMEVSRLDAFTPEQAAAETRFNTKALADLNRISLEGLPHKQWILARILRHTFESGVHAKDDYWLEFAVTPYNGVAALLSARRMMDAVPLTTAAQRENYLRLLDEYARMVKEVAAKTRAQAERGIRVPRPAIEGVRTTFAGLGASATQMFAASGARLGGLNDKDRKAFEAAVAERINEQIVPAYGAVVAIFDERYVSAAPVAVGIGQYPGGPESYLRRITCQTGLKLTPQEIHERGLAAVSELQREMDAIRTQLKYPGDQASFEQKLRADPRYFPKTPEDLEKRYLQYVARIEPKVPQYFSRLPKAPYGVKRLDPAGEVGMTYGYYQSPTPEEQRGYYRYNGTNLDKRSLIMAPHLIYHELIPGHHFQIALLEEDKSLHPVRQYVLDGAFTEGWAEYAAHLAAEMGGYPDPYESYGHLLTQMFMASRLVVDTGMNALGWPLERARQYMRAHGSESDALAATETLRYSTDLYGQALGYRLGYEQFQIARRAARAALGEGFDIRAFHAAAVENGSMPLDVLKEHMEWFVAQQTRRSRQALSVQ